MSNINSYTVLYICVYVCVCMCVYVCMCVCVCVCVCVSDHKLKVKYYYTICWFLCDVTVT